jgi:hypothetical protein
VLMVFVGMDLMALLSTPEERTEQTRAEFIAWADRYMHGHQDQPYRYTGRDLYGARCAALHAFGARSRFHGITVERLDNGSRATPKARSGR